MNEFMNSSKITDQKTIDDLNKEILREKMAQFIVQPTSPNFDVVHDDVHHIDFNDPHLIVHHELPSIVNFNNLQNFKFSEKNLEKNENVIPNNNQFFAKSNKLKNLNNLQMPPQNIDPFKPFYLNQKDIDKNLTPQINFDFISKGLKVDKK